jgi:hypothetical protein
MFKKLQIKVRTAMPGLQRGYSECLKSHIVDIASNSTQFIIESHSNKWPRTSYREQAASEFYISSLKPAVTNSVDFDLYYKPLVERIRDFQHVDAENDDTILVSEQTINEVLGFVRSVLPDVRRPAAALGADGSIALVWQDSKRYITAVFYGTGSYSYIVRQQKQIVAAASSRADAIPVELRNPICQFFERA